MIEENWTEFKIGNKQKSLQLMGKTHTHEAVAFCQFFNASLVLPRSEQENTDLSNAFLALGINGGALDGNDAAKEGEWVDSAGQPLTYTNWRPGEPSNSSKKNYLTWYLSEGKGQWSTAQRCSTCMAYVVCERPVKSKVIS